MKATFSLITCLIVLLVIACQKPAPRIAPIEASDLSEVQIDSVLEQYKFTYESPILIEDSEVVLIPISTEANKNSGRKRFFSGSQSYASGYSRYWNVLFYNRATGATRLLTEEKFSISNIDSRPEPASARVGGSSLKGKILYRIRDTDFNHNQSLGYEDPEFLFVSEVDGTGLQRISPEQEHLISYEVLPQAQQIILQTRRDTQKDSIFDRNDELIWYKAELMNSRWNITEIIDSIGRKDIEKLYFEQWLQKNE